MTFSNSQWNFMVALAGVGAIEQPATPGATVTYYQGGQPEGWSMGGSYYSPGTVGEKVVEKLRPMQELHSSDIVELAKGESQPGLPALPPATICEMLNKHFANQRMFAVGQEFVLAQLGIKHECGGGAAGTTWLPKNKSASPCEPAE